MLELRDQTHDEPVPGHLAPHGHVRATLVPSFPAVSPTGEDYDEQPRRWNIYDGRGLLAGEAWLVHHGRSYAACYHPTGFLSGRDRAPWGTGYIVGVGGVTLAEAVDRLDAMIEGHRP